MLYIRYHQSLVSKDEFPHVQTQPPTDASAAVLQNINSRLQSIETNMILLMSKCIINEAEPAELLPKENTTTSILPENTNILNFDTLMFPCRTVKHIETFFPYLKYIYDGHFVCKTCETYLDFTNNRGKGLKCTFQYDMSNGMDFTNAKQLPQEFRSLKNNLKVHVKESNLHKEASAWIENREQTLDRQRRFSERAGLTVSRHAYSILYRGRPYSDFTIDILLAAMGGAVTGDLNHSERFVDNFRSSSSSILQRMLKQYRKASSSSV